MKLSLNDLTNDEQHWLKALHRGSAALLTVDMANRLKMLGLADEKLGGTGISRAGKLLIDGATIANHKKRSP